MAKCSVVLNPAVTGVPYVGRSMLVADVEARNDGTYWTTTESRVVPLANSPLVSIDLDRLTAYAFVLPDGSSSVRKVPDEESASFSGLEILSSVPGTPAFVVEQATWVLLSTDPLPVQAEPGQTYFETNTYVFGQIGA